MKSYKKIGFGLLPILALIIFITVFGPAKKAFADASSPTPDISKATFTFINRNEIDATFPDGTQVAFIDGNDDGNHSFQAAATNFCGISGGDIGDNVDTINGFNPGDISTGATVTANISMNLDVKGAGQLAGTCTRLNSVAISVSNPANAAAIVLAGDATGATDVFTQTALSPLAGTPLLGAASDLKSCFGGEVATITGTQATIYYLTPDPLSSNLGDANKVLPAISSGNCWISKAPITGNLGPASAAEGSAAASTLGGATGGGDACDTNSGGWALAWLACPVLNALDSLASSLMNLFTSQLPFTIEARGGAVNCAPDANSADSTAVTTCGQDFSNGKDQLQNVWSIMRDLASGLIVIVMLAMVISQAMGGGLFEAYTIRKMLPRLVAAVILIQLSFTLFSFVIDIVDDIGNGLAGLMAAPFGGTDALSFGQLLNNAGIGLTGGFFINALALAGIAILLVAALPTVLMFCFMGIMALLFGIGVLVFRKVLILLLLIFSPLALVVWIFPSPGMQRYWKLWWDNFLKTLLMYPIIIAIIYAGRIFAFVSAGSENKQTTLLNFVFIMIGWFAPLFIIVKAYKWGGSAMQSAGQYASRANSKVSEKPNAYFKKRQEDHSAERRRSSQERFSGKSDYKRGRGWYQKPLDRFRSGQYDPLRGGKGSRNRFESTAQYSAAGRESSGKTAEAAKAAAQQILDNAADHDEVARQFMSGEKFDWIDKKGRKHHYEPPASKSGQNYMRAAGASAIRKYGTDGSNRVFQAEIDRMRAAGGDEALLAEEILDDNVDGMKGKMDSMYRGFNREEYQRVLGEEEARQESEGAAYVADPQIEQKAIRAARLGSIHASIDSMKADWFQGMEGTEAQSLIAGLTQSIAAGDAPGASKAQRQQAAVSKEKLKTLWRNYKEANANPNIHAAPGVHKAFKALADGNFGGSADGSIENINENREDEIYGRYRGDLVTGTRINPVTGKEEDIVERPTGTHPRTRKPTDGVVTLRGDRKPVLDRIDRDAPGVQSVIQEMDMAPYMGENFNPDGAALHTHPVDPHPAAEQTGDTSGELDIQHGQQQQPAGQIILPSTVQSVEPGVINVPQAGAAAPAPAPGPAPQLTKEFVQTLGPQNAVGWVQSRGGVTALANSDLVLLHNHSSGAIRQAALAELQRRGVPQANVGDRPDLPG